MAKRKQVQVGVKNVPFVNALRALGIEISQDKVQAALADVAKWQTLYEKYAKDSTERRRIGLNMRLVRIIYDIPHDELVQACGVSGPIAKLLSGHLHRASYAAFVSVCAGLGVHPQVMLEENLPVRIRELIDGLKK